MPPLRVGHKGAAHIAPGNTRESFQAALAAGVDMIEFDVLSERPDGSGRLLLAHDYEDLRSRTPITLEEGLEHFASDTYSGIALDVDVKLPGYGPRLVSALRQFDLIGRSLVSSMFMDDLDVMRRAEPALRVGWSVPRVRRDYTKDLLTALPALLVLHALRLRMPARAGRALRDGRVDAIMAHWRVVTPRLIRAVARAGGDLYVWTVDDPALLAKLSACEVTGIITNDPRLFATPVRPAARPQSTAEAARGDDAGTEPGASASLPDPAS
jgi:glycerophosphoryl diester phosphodiesterase